MPDSKSTYLMKPQKGNLSNYGRDPQYRRRGMPDGSGKNSGDGSEGAPQVYVRMMVDFSYDKPRPDPDGELRKECGAAIRREVEKALTGDLLATKLGDASLTLRAMVMRQEDTAEAFGQPVAISVQGQAGGKSVRFEPPSTPAARPGIETVPKPTPAEARPSLGNVPLPGGIGCFPPVEYENDIPPNAGSSE